jgi:hypothetical protein
MNDFLLQCFITSKYRKSLISAVTTLSPFPHRWMMVNAPVCFGHFLASSIALHVHLQDWKIWHAFHVNLRQTLTLTSTADYIINPGWSISGFPPKRDNLKLTSTYFILGKVAPELFPLEVGINLGLALFMLPLMWSTMVHTVIDIHKPSPR